MIGSMIITIGYRYMHRIILKCVDFILDYCLLYGNALNPTKCADPDMEVTY